MHHQAPSSPSLSHTHSITWESGGRQGNNKVKYVHTNTKDFSLYNTFKNVYINEGIYGFYKGYLPRIMKKGCSGGLLWTLYEKMSLSEKTNWKVEITYIGILFLYISRFYVDKKFREGWCHRKFANSKVWTHCHIHCKGESYLIWGYIFDVYINSGATGDTGKYCITADTFSLDIASRIWKKIEGK